jgi:hypothetical protein
MAKKRIEKIPGARPAAVAGAPGVARHKPAPAREGLQAFCPVCGRMVMDRQVGDPLSPRTVDYFDSIEWDPDKPFGVAKSLAGYSSLRDWRYITPEEAPELFAGMRARFLQALREWLDKGWISREEIKGVLGAL